jgi:hypothetical protein
MGEVWICEFEFLFYSEWGLLAGCYEHGKESPGLIKCGELQVRQAVLLASHEGLCSVDFVRT